MAYKIFLHDSDTSACSFYRSTLPFQHCYSILSQNNILLKAGVKPEEEFDCYIFSRLIRPDFFNGFVSQIVDKNLVYQTDDDIWHIPEWNPSGKLLTSNDLESTAAYINLANKVVVSTQPLSDLINTPEKSIVLPNLVDLAHFKECEKQDDFLTILWCGSASHHGDLQEIVDPIIKISEKYKDVRIIFWGYLPTELGIFQRVPGYPYAEIVPKYPNIFKGEWFSLNLYFDKLSALKPDIAIIPIQNCQFNYSKSNLKFLEMSIAGAACVATDLPPYECIKHGETGYLAKNSDDWYNYLVELIENKNNRNNIIKNAQEQIRQEYSWQCSKRKLWEEFFLTLKN